jgi:hypothetical protein
MQHAVEALQQKRGRVSWCNMQMFAEVFADVQSHSGAAGCQANLVLNRVPLLPAFENQLDQQHCLSRRSSAQFTGPIIQGSQPSLAELEGCSFSYCNRHSVQLHGLGPT